MRAMRTLLRSVVVGSVCSVFSTLTITAHAAPEEIQVYLDEFADPGKVGLDLHTIYTSTSRLTTGDLPARQLRITPELSFGVNEHLETAVYFLTNSAPGQGIQTDGVKVRVRYRPLLPNEESHWYTAVNIEIGKLSRRFNDATSNGEFKGILVWHSGPWKAGLNLNIDRALQRRSASPTTFEFDTKVSRALSNNFSIGVENYAFRGPIRGRLAGMDPSQTTFLATDFSIDKWDINLGVGYARGDIPDKLIIKSIIGIPF